MNESELIDDLNPVAPKSTDRAVRRLVSILSVLILILAAFCYMDIVGFLNTYAGLRGKILLGAESLHGMVSTFFIASIPAIAYNCRDKKATDYTIISYLPPLILTSVLFVVFLILGMELLFVIPSGLNNSLMPGVMIVPPFSFFFDLLFISASLMSFLVLKVSFKKRRK
ncbi:hypothetical protein D3C87_21660 [compost metagenome]